MTQEEVERWFDGFTYRELHRTVKRLIGRAGFTPQDRHDLFQELAGQLIRKLVRYDRRRGHPYVFVRMVLARCAAKMLRDRRAQKRNHRGIQSLHLNRRDPNPSRLRPAQEWGDADNDRRRSRHPRTSAELSQLVSDVREVIASLPEDLQELAHRLQTQTVSEIARETEIPRTTLSDAARQIRKRFERSDLHKYLENRPSTRTGAG